MTFGSALRALRQRNGLTQRELGEKVGVSTPYISKIEADREYPSTGLIERMADVVGVPVGDLLAMGGYCRECLGTGRHQPVDTDMIGQTAPVHASVVMAEVLVDLIARLQSVGQRCCTIGHEDRPASVEAQTNDDQLDEWYPYCASCGHTLTGYPVRPLS